MLTLIQSTAVTVKIGPFVDSGDGVTAETGLTIQKADVRLSKNGGNMAAANADQGVGDAGAAHDEIGVYDVSLDTTDTNTLGRLQLFVAESGALPVWAEFMVVTATRGLAGTALPDAAANAAGGLPISAAGSLALDDLAKAGDQMDLVDEPNSDAIAEIQSGLMTSGEFIAPDNTGIGNAATDAATAAAAAAAAQTAAEAAKLVTDKLDTMIEAVV